MKKMAFAIFLSLLLVNVYSYYDTPTEQNCYYSAGTLVCQTPAALTDAVAVISEGVTCFSDNGTYPDYGCFATIAFAKNTNILNCTYHVEYVAPENDYEREMLAISNQTMKFELVYDPCKNVTIEKGDVYFAEIKPEEIDYSSCPMSVNDSVYVIDCPLAGKEVTFSGTLQKVSGEDMVFIVGINKANEFNLLKFILENLIYIVLVLIIIVLLYWIFSPHKPMRIEKERVSQREKRYGRT
jgi:hypothetical protein